MSAARKSQHNHGLTQQRIDHAARTVQKMTAPSPPPSGHAPSGDTPESDGAASPWPAFAVCIAVGALTILDLSGVNVALPSIQKSLGASSTQLQLIVAGYTLAFGLTLVPAGRLGDLYARRTMFIIGVSSFIAASTLCALAPNDVWLTTARIVQGAAAGIQMPQVLGLIQQLFQGKDRGRAFGIFGAMVGVATALGPTLGGLLLALGRTDTGWRFFFLLNVPLGVIALLFAIRLLPRKQEHGNEGKQLDPVGILILGLSIFCLMLPFLLTTGTGPDDPLRWLWLTGFFVGGGAFVLWERSYSRRGKSPIVHFDLFAIRSYRNGILVAAAWFAGLPAGFLITTLYLQEGLHRSPLLAGLVTVPFALSSGATAWIGGRLVEKYGRKLVVVGIIIAIVGISMVLLAATLSPPETTEWLMAGGMLVAGAGGGFVISPNQTLTLSEIPVTEGSAAGSMGQLGQRIGTAVGVSAVTALFFSAITANQGAGQLADFHRAFRDGFLVTLALLFVSLAIGLFDLRARAKDAQA